MEDRELLEAAARAAGYEPARLTDDETAVLLKGVQQPWNPRDRNPHSDCMGDALRLAIACGMTVCTDGVSTVSALAGYGHDRVTTTQSDGCKDAATRHAIVRTAAKLWTASHPDDRNWQLREGDPFGRPE